MILREKPGKPIVHAVQRGGNWNNGANAGALSVNLNNAPSHTNSNIGFRCTSQVRSRKKGDAARSSELPALGGRAEKLWEAHRLACKKATGFIPVLPAQFSAANISQHPILWCLECQATASTDDIIQGGEAEAW